MQTPIAYYGGKQAMLPHIMPLIPHHTVYTEAFAGGLAVFWSKVPAPVEVINDKDDFVINFYRQLKGNFAELNTLIQGTLHSRSERDRANRIRKHPAKHTEVERAWAFWVCTLLGWGHKIGGGFRYSTLQRVPGAKTTNNYKRRFTNTLARRLERTEIENIDALKVIATRDRAFTFHYIDPPYIGANQGHYAGYTDQQFIDLLELLSKASGKWLLSSYTSEILKGYIQANGWYVRSFEKPLMHSKHRSSKRKVEILTANYNIHAMHSMDLFHNHHPSPHASIKTTRI